MELSNAHYIKNFKGFTIMDCAVRSENILYFSLCENSVNDINRNGGSEADVSVSRRIVYFVASASPDDQWGYAEFIDDTDDFKICVSRKPKEQMIGVDDDGQVFAFGNGSNEIEKRLEFLRGGVARCRAIDGYAYAAGSGRSVAFRKDRNKCIPLMQGLPYSDDDDWETAGFEDIDGFNVNDIYCVGGEGDVWHFDGSRWEKIPFPSTLDLYSVCCAGDGKVYISGYRGTTFRGRGQEWEQIHAGKMTLPFKDMVWHDGKVWCTSDYGLWQITNGKLKTANVPGEIKICSGHLSAYGDVLLIAGHSGAACMIAGVWHKLF